MLDIMKDFYSDGKPHKNRELYELFSDLVGYEGYEERNHVLRALQQRLKQNGYLVNVGYGIWQKA